MASRDWLRVLSISDKGRENKYIVKKRTESSLNTKTPEPLTNNNDEESNDNTNEQTDEPATDEQEEPKSTEEVKPKRDFSPEARRAEPTTKPKKTTPKPKQLPTIPSFARPPMESKRIRESNPADLTISYEILNQLKKLWNEIKQKRINKEQKSLIEQVVQKQMTKRPRKKVIEQIAADEDNEDEYEYEYDDSSNLSAHTNRTE